MNQCPQECGLFLFVRNLLYLLVSFTSELRLCWPLPGRCHGRRGIPINVNPLTALRSDITRNTKELMPIDRKPEFFKGGQLKEGIIGDRKSTRLNSSHSQISYAVFCLKKKNRCDSLQRRRYYRLKSRSQLISVLGAHPVADHIGARTLPLLIPRATIDDQPLDRVVHVN